MAYPKLGHLLAKRNIIAPETRQVYSTITPDMARKDKHMIRSQAFLVFSIAILALALGGCASKTLPPTPGTEAATPTSGGSLSPAATDTNRSFTYSCDNGQTVKASYTGSDLAEVHYQGQAYDMHIAISADGARYVGHGYEWWTRGDKGTLFRHRADGTTGEDITVCQQT